MRWVRNVAGKVEKKNAHRILGGNESLDIYLG
jgi:hypothetical protein